MTVSHFTPPLVVRIISPVVVPTIAVFASIASTFDSHALVTPLLTPTWCWVHVEPLFVDTHTKFEPEYAALAPWIHATPPVRNTTLRDWMVDGLTAVRDVHVGWPKLTRHTRASTNE